MLNNFDTDFFKLALKFTDPFALGEELIAHLQKRFKADRCLIITFDKDTGKPEIRAKSPELENDEFSNWVIQKTIENNGQAVYFPNAKEEPDCSKSVANYQFLSVISIPLKYREKLMGVLYLDKISEFIEFHPAHFEEIRDISASILQILIQQEEILKLKIESKIRKLNYFIGTSKGMQEVYKQIELVSKTDTNVYIYGESGTGKELVARALHDLSPRKDKPFIALNCATIPNETAESELFGHTKGAFTGAVSDKLGFFLAAEKGTLFIDEIGDLALPVQGKLLRVLEERKVKRLGSDRETEFDVRLIFAGSDNLAKRVNNNTFREELFYRLNVFKISLPPLRERKEDIPSLVYHFLEMFCKVHKKFPLSISVNAMNLLQAHNWRGNIRELKNVIERTVIMHEGNNPITANEFFLDSSKSQKTKDFSAKSLDEMISDIVRSVYENSNKNVTRTAKALQTTRQRVQRILKKEI